jgi:hypothetical protein
VKLTQRSLVLVLLAALGCSIGFGQVTDPLGGLAESYREAIRLRIEMEKARALENESNARAEAIRAETERLRQRQKWTRGITLYQNSRLQFCLVRGICGWFRSTVSPVSG